MKDWDKKNLGTSLDNWTMEELEAALVQDYEGGQNEKGEEIYALAEAWAKRKIEAGEPAPDVNDMWEDFTAFYYPEEKQEKLPTEKSAKEMSKAKTAKKRWIPRYVKWVAAAVILLMIGVVSSNDGACADMTEWMNDIALWAGLAYEEKLADYEKEVNLQAASEGYTLYVYKLAQTSTLLIVEYEVKDQSGEIVGARLSALNLASDVFGQGAYGCQMIPLLPDGETGHSRMLLVYNGTEEIDFTQMEGKTQSAEFYAYLENSDENVVFPEMEFVLENIYPRTVVQVEETLHVEDYYYHVEEIVDEGILLRAKVQKTDSEEYLGEGWLRLRISDKNGALAFVGAGSHTLEGEEHLPADWIYDFQRGELAKGKITIQAVFSEDVTGGDDSSMDVFGDKITVEIP